MESGPKNSLLGISMVLRAAQYFEELQMRKDFAIREYSVIQKAIQKEKMKDTDMFKT